MPEKNSYIHHCVVRICGSYLSLQYQNKFFMPKILILALWTSRSVVGLLRVCGRSVVEVAPGWPSILCCTCSGLSVGPLSWLLQFRLRSVVAPVSGSRSVRPCSRVSVFSGRTVIAATRVCCWSVVSECE